MTKSISTLAKLKLEVINYHNINKPSFRKDEAPAVNEKFLIGLARDACYTSNNSLGFKKKQVADSLAEYDIAVDEKNSYAMERTERWINTLMPELEELQTRHDADTEVFAIITHGEVWQPKKSAASKPAKPANFSNLRLRVA